MARIKLVGLEVEGGWDGEAGVRPLDIPLVADHSIDGVTVRSDKPLTCAHIGEAVSIPLCPDVETIHDWISKYWPKYANNTCGFHIHLSTHNPKDYSLLTTKFFAFTLTQSLVSYGKKLQLPADHYLFKRLAGNNAFANASFDASNQIRLRQKTIGNRIRYGLFNYAFGIHGTVEFRAFPTFETADLAEKFTMFYLNKVEGYLQTFEKNFNHTYRAVMEEKGGSIGVSLGKI